MLPWKGRSGRLSPLKLAVFLGLLAPAAWLAGLALASNLGARPLTVAIHFAGLWAVRFLLICLAVTPLRRLARWSELILVRRMLGVASFGYALLHLTLYAVDQNLDLGHVAAEIWLRIYLAIGATALAGLLALAVTSTDGWIRRLGGKRWQRLHRLVYAIAVLALIHFFLQSKLDVSGAVLMAGLFLWLMGYRLMVKFAPGFRPASLFALALAAALGTALIEAGWYAAAAHADAARVLAANLTLYVGVRPAWWVLVTALGAAALAFARDRRAPRDGQARRAPLAPRPAAEPVR